MSSQDDDTLSVWSDYSESLTSEQHSLVDQAWLEDHPTDVTASGWVVHSTPSFRVTPFKNNTPLQYNHGRLPSFGVGWTGR